MLKIESRQRTMSITGEHPPAVGCIRRLLIYYLFLLNVRCGSLPCGLELITRGRNPAIHAGITQYASMLGLLAVLTFLMT